jgi:DNA-binding beta-propeller fold protein YncE
VVDFDNHRVQAFAAAGKFLLQFGGQGSANGQFNHPTDVAIDAQKGILYVSDWGNHRIQKFQIMER